MADPMSNDSNHQDAASKISHELFDRCIHCGLCTASCPTYLESGNENDGPRGRIQLMQSVVEGRSDLTERMRRHLQLCLDCRACETTCPSGVEYGRLIEAFRLYMQQSDQRPETRYDWFRELFLLRVFPSSHRMRRLLAPLRLLQQTGIHDAAERLGMLNLLPGRLGEMMRFLYPAVKSGPRLPKFLPAVGRRRARVAFFVGCVADAMFRHCHWATLRVLQQNGCDVVIPEGQGCCGAISFQAGDRQAARILADSNLLAFELDRYDAIVVNHAGCGAMMKQYGWHWRDGLQPHRERFAAKVKDVHEFLDVLGPVPPSGRINAVATYEDACQLGHTQKIADAPRRLLELIPGLELRELPETEICCGSAGGYCFREIEMSHRLARRKLQNVLSTGAQIVLAADASCLLQIARQVRSNGNHLLVMHPMELLDLSYRAEQPQWPQVLTGKP
jgi:glycolate oxidase iron-sulfur subunit